MDYQADRPAELHDLMIQKHSGPEPQFDPVVREFLQQGYSDLKDHVLRGSLLQFASLGIRIPWLYRLTFSTRGYTRDTDGEIRTADRHVVALRFQPNYLRRANRFEMLKLVEPSGTAFHPNISPMGAICLEIYAGESVVEICHSLHDLIRWRLRQYDESDALNPIACAWGRDNIREPIDDRPLFGRGAAIQWKQVQ